MGAGTVASARDSGRALDLDGWGRARGRRRATAPTSCTPRTPRAQNAIALHRARPTYPDSPSAARARATRRFKTVSAQNRRAGDGGPRRPLQPGSRTAGPAVRGTDAYGFEGSEQPVAGGGSAGGFAAGEDDEPLLVLCHAGVRRARRWTRSFPMACEAWMAVDSTRWARSDSGTARPASAEGPRAASGSARRSVSVVAAGSAGSAVEHGPPPSRARVLGDRSRWVVGERRRSAFSRSRDSPTWVRSGARRRGPRPRLRARRGRRVGSGTRSAG